MEFLDDWPERAVLVETALLSHGLPSLSDEQIFISWPVCPDVQLVWLENGRIYRGGIERFLQNRSNPWLRIDGKSLDEAITGRYSGFLTASALMQASRNSLNPVVTAGMGGIRKERVSYDLVLLSQQKSLLIASSPKDSQDIGASIAYLQQNGVSCLTTSTPFCDGFLFQDTAVLLDAVYGGESVADLVAEKSCLLLNPLPPDLRLHESGMLLESLKVGDEAFNKGYDFHPAVNQALDKLSAGWTSQLQLQALIANLNLAVKIQEIVP